jgi:DNA repair protein RadD
MLRRPYQERLVSRAVEALDTFGNTLAVSPTGSGKTLMLSWLAGDLGVEKSLVLQHRDELTSQNLEKFSIANPGIPTSVFDSRRKDWDGQAVFAMVQTLCRDANRQTMPRFDLLVIDEAHHAVAPTYRKIIEDVKAANPDCLVAGFTATPGRGDGKGLRPVFDNVCDQITLGELINLGFLVPPRTFIQTLPETAEALKKVRLKGGEFDMDEVAAIMDATVHNERMVSLWREHAGDRQSIVFCSTVAHTEHVCATFQKAGVRAAVVTGETPEAERKAILDGLTTGRVQVVVNCAVLTEGFDCPRVSCIVLCRPCSYKSTMMQMIGRGLRPADRKKDCVVLDFGTSILTHGDLDQSPLLDDKEKGEAPQKECPGCNAVVPASVRECPICGFEFQGQDGSGTDGPEVILDATLIEVEILKRSPFKWIDLFGGGKVLVASGFNAFVAVASTDGESWQGLGKPKQGHVETLLVGDKSTCLSAADDFLRRSEDSDAAKKSRRWLNDPATGKQIELLSRVGYQPGLDFSFTKYSAACHLNFQWTRRAIENALHL